MVLLYGPTGWQFLMRVVPLYCTCRALGGGGFVRARYPRTRPPDAASVRVGGCCGGNSPLLLLPRALPPDLDF